MFGVRAPKLGRFGVAAHQPAVVIANIDSARDGIMSRGRGGDERLVLGQTLCAEGKRFYVRHGRPPQLETEPSITSCAAECSRALDATPSAILRTQRLASRFKYSTRLPRSGAD